MNDFRRLVRRFPVRALLAVLFLSAPAAGETIRLRPGFQHILEQPGARRISVGNPELVEARPLSGREGILLVGKKPGETDLYVWSGDSRVAWRIEVSDSSRSEEEARELARSFPGLSVSRAGNQVLLRGELRNPADKSFLEELTRGRPDFRVQVELPPEKAALIAFDLKILEISRGDVAKLGIRWPDGISASGAFRGGTAGGEAFTLSSDFDLRLNLLLSEGKARILANPRLVCESGKNATFLAGGEIPIVIVTPETRSVEWKTYGIILDLASRREADGTIRTRITAEISTVDHGSGTSDVPGLLTRRVSTHFSTPPETTVMLSGLVKSESARDVSRVPLLGQIPILGELFKSRSFRENQTELAIFITPREVHGNARDELDEWDAKDRRERNSMRLRWHD